MLKVLVVTLFPEMFEAITGHGISGRAVRNGLVELDTLNPRDYAANSHRNVDDRPYGGGPGMVMMVQPLQDALREARVKRPGAKVIYLSPQGRPLDQAGVVKLATDRDLVLICGRYEGIDERFIELEVDEEWSVGDYVVSGGELPAMLLIDAMVRTLPGALGHEDSADEDSFVNGLLDYPHYTRPESYQGLAVPAVLLSGDHARIRRWRMKQALGRTWERRPDLLEKLVLDAEQEALLQEYREESNNTLSSQPE